MTGSPNDVGTHTLSMGLPIGTRTVGGLNL
jgi:hypothetical protein